MGDYPSANPFQVEPDLANRLVAAKERVWFRIGVLQSTMNDRERALNAFERVLAVNPGNVRAMTQAGAVLAKKECYPQAVAYLQRAINEDDSCGEAWAVLAHCYVMTDDLQKAYQAYQSALSHLPNPRDPNLWYGIGLLYDRYGSLDNALEAFLAVLSISPDFERADEVCFCIGIIYKEQQNFDDALKYFNKVVVAANPPPPLTRADGWYQIGHVNELKRDIPTALEMYKRALAENPKHPRTLQNYGWLEHQHNNNSSEAIRLLKRSSELDSNDGQTWYLLGRVYMALREYRQAYNAYQQAVYRDGGNATFWCSIGVLYYQMNQYRDAMDAYSRAIRLNPLVSEVWYDLGTLYESCGQNADAIDAYRRAAQLAPENTQITARLGVLENSINPAAHPQPGTSQPQQPASQPISQGQLPHVPSEGHNSNQPHMQPQLNPVFSRPMGGPVHQVPLPAVQESKIPQQQPSVEAPQLHPSSQISSQQANVGRHHITPNTAPLNMPPRSGQAGIPSMQPPDIPPMDTTQTQNGSYPLDRSTHPNQLSSIQLPSPQNMTSGNNRNFMMSQPLPPPRSSQLGQTQPQSLMLSPPSLGSRQDDPIHMRRPASLPQPQLQPLSKSGALDRLPQVHHTQIAPIEPQQQGSSFRPQLQQQTSGEEPQRQVTDAQEPGPVLPSQVPRQPTSQVQGHDRLPSPAEAQQHHGGTPTNQISSQPPTSLPKLQALNQMQPIPQIQQKVNEDEKKQDQKHMLPSAESGQSSTSVDHASEGRGYGGPDNRRRIGFDAEDKEDRSRPPGLPRPENPANNSLSQKNGGFELPESSRPSTSGGMSATEPSGQVHTMSGADRNVQPAPSAAPRSMSMHELTELQSGEQRKHAQNDKKMEVDTPERNRPDPSRSEDDHGREGAQSADQLPALRPLGTSAQMKSSDRASRDEQNPLHSLPKPSLPLPSTNALPSIGADNSENQISSSLNSGPSVSGAPPSLGSSVPSLPPLAVHTSGNFGSGNKDAAGSGGQLTHGASSLTKFGKGIGRTPVTPVSNPVAHSPLPSPLPTRKNANSSGPLHVSRSPRLSMPSSVPPFKSAPVAPSSATFGAPMESVPSPSSLPVLPALSSRPSRDDDEKEPAPGGKTDHGKGQDDHKDGQDGSKGDDKNSQHPESGGRRSDEALANRPIFGMLRSAPAPIPSSDKTQIDQDEGERTQNAKSSLRPGGENMLSSKREGSSKEDSGRTAKRPRLHDGNDADNSSQPFGFGSSEKAEKAGMKQAQSDHGGDQAMDVSSAGQSEIHSFKDIKADVQGPSNSSKSDGEGSNAKDAGTRNGDVDVSKGASLQSPVADIPRLPNPTSKLPSSLPIGSDTPLPSFRSERMNISAARAGNGASGKSGGSEGGSGLPFLKSAPISSMPPSLKSMAVPSAKGKDRTDFGSEGRGIKGVGEDKREQGVVDNQDARGKEDSDHIANGGNQKNGGSGSPLDREGQRSKELKTKEESSATRTEVHSTAT